MSENPPRGKNLKAESPPVDPEIQEQVRDMRSEAKELHYALLEGMKEKGLTPEQVGDLWERAVILNKSLTDTTEKFRKEKDPEERARLLAYFEEARNNLEQRVMPEVLNSVPTGHEEETKTLPEEVEQPAAESTNVNEAVVSHSGGLHGMLDSIPQGTPSLTDGQLQDLRHWTDQKFNDLERLKGSIPPATVKKIARALTQIAKTMQITSPDSIRTYLKELDDVERGTPMSREDSESEPSEIQNERPHMEAVTEPEEAETLGVPEANEKISPEPEAIPLTSLEQSSTDVDWTPKDTKDRLTHAVEELTSDQEDSVKYKKAPLNFTESESESPIQSSEPETSEDGSERSATDMRTHAHVLALETRGPEAMQKLKDAFKPYDPNRATGNEARTTVEMAEKSAPYTEKMYVAEKAYLDAVKAHHKSRGSLSMLAEQFVKHKDPKEVQNLRDEWVKARAEYAGFLNESAKARYVEKDGAFNKEKSVLERYQRMVVAREVVLGAEEAEQRAKLEGLGKREHDALDKALAAYKKLPPGVRILGTAALFTGGAALAAGGGAIAAVPLALGGTSAALRWYAEAKGSKVASMLSRLTSIGAIAGLAGEYGTKAVHAALGTEEKAAETIGQREVRSGSGARTKAANLGDAAALSSLSREREKALGATETVQRHSRVARFLSSMTGGALFGGAFHEHAAPVPGHESYVPHEEVSPNPLEHTAPFRESSMGYQQMSADDLKHVYHAEDTAPHHDAAPSHEAQHTTVHPGHRTHLDHSSRADSGHVAEAAPVVHLTDEDRNLIQEWEIKNGGLPPHSDEHITEVIARLREDNGPDAFKDVHFEAVHTVESPAPDVVPETPAAAEPVPAPEPTPEPAHEVPPQPEAPAVHHEAPVATEQHEAPVVHAAPESHPVHETPAPSTHIDTPPAESHDTDTDTYDSHDTAPMNTHGLIIDRESPHIYTDDKDNLVVHGGTPQQQDDLRKAFLGDPKNFGKPLIMITPTIDPLTGKQDMVGWVTDERGRIEYMGILADEKNVPYTPLTENDFIKKVL